jgi:HD superfamily phosphohydrolase YqeK
MTDDDSFAHYLLFIRTQLSDARIRHSIGVMQVMAELAPIYSLDRARAMTAGLLHDAARNVSDGDLLEEASLLHAAWVVEYFQEQAIPIHPNLSAERDALAAKLTVPASFFDRD